jgi:hypothetical protein
MSPTFGAAAAREAIQTVEARSFDELQRMCPRVTVEMFHEKGIHTIIGTIDSDPVIYCASNNLTIAHVQFLQSYDLLNAYSWTGLRLRSTVRQTIAVLRELRAYFRRR